MQDIPNLRTVKAIRGDELVIDLKKTYSGTLTAWMKKTPTSNVFRSFDIVDNRYLKLTSDKTIDYYDNLGNLVETVGGRWYFDVEQLLDGETVSTTIYKGSVLFDNDITNSVAIESVNGENIIKTLVSKEDKSNKGIAGGYAPLDETGKIPSQFYDAGTGGNINQNNTISSSVIYLFDPNNVESHTIIDAWLQTQTLIVTEIDIPEYTFIIIRPTSNVALNYLWNAGKGNFVSPTLANFTLNNTRLATALELVNYQDTIVTNLGTIPSEGFLNAINTASPILSFIDNTKVYLITYSIPTGENFSYRFTGESHGYKNYGSGEIAADARDFRIVPNSIEHTDLTDYIEQRLQTKLNANTGFGIGLNLTINIDNTKFNIAAGTYIVTDFTDPYYPTPKIIRYDGAQEVSPTYLATHNASYIALDINKNIIQSPSPFSNEDRRTLCILGAVIHPNNLSIITTNEIKAPILAPVNQLHDLIKAIGTINLSGNIYGANGANLKLNKTAGIIFGLGINPHDYTNPHALAISQQTALSFAYRLRTGLQYADTTDINPNSYDNQGVLTDMPAGNKYSIQRINLFQSGLTRIQYGQAVYNSFSEALNGVTNEPFIAEQNIAENAIFRAYLVIKRGTLDLAAAISVGDARFVPVDKFGNVIGNASISLTYANIIAALGYTPENLLNKSSNAALGTSDILFPTQNAVRQYVLNTAVTPSGQQTLSNKTIVPRTVSVDYSTLTNGNFQPNLDLADIYHITGINGILNFLSPIGTYNENKTLQVFLKDDISQQTITFALGYSATSLSSLPTKTLGTVNSKLLLFRYSSIYDGTFGCELS